MTDISTLGHTPYERLKTLMRTLRSPDGGCPWDVEQSFETIAPYTIEEAYEVSDAIDRKDMSALKEELGDLLFQVVFHSQIADENGTFNLDDVCDTLVRKMVDRHPHVFEATDDRTSDEQTVAWEDMKANERRTKGGGSVLDGVALALPALMRAEKLQKRAARVGFDWPTMDGVLGKITEEAAELAESDSPETVEDEMGDLIFAVTNLARKLGVDPELALRKTNNKFTKRFKHIEKKAELSGHDISNLSLDEMEEHWQDAKSL